MKPALKRPDDVGVPGDARTEMRGQTLNKMVARVRAGGLAGSKPQGRERRAHMSPELSQGRGQFSRLGQGRRVEGVVADQRASPLSVTPHLDLVNRLMVRHPQRLAERLRP